MNFIVFLVLGLVSTFVKLTMVPKCEIYICNCLNTMLVSRFIIKGCYFSSKGGTDKFVCMKSTSIL